MVDPERLQRICNELSSDPRYAVGSKRYPLAVSDEEAVAIADALAEEFDEGVVQREKLAQRQGLNIYCRAGCTACCSVLVVCYRPEALRIAGFLRQHEAEKNWFLLQFPYWLKRAGETPELAQRAFLQGRQAEYERLHLEHFGQAIPCPFLRAGQCTVYPVRPLGCKNAHALDTAEYCSADGGRPADAVDFVPLNRLLVQATQLFHALHNIRSRERHGQKPVGQAVYDLLTAK